MVLSEYYTFSNGVEIPQLGLGTWFIEVSKAPEADTAYMKNNADVDFEISDEDMDLLKSAQTIESYGEYSVFPVFSGK